MPIAPFDRNTPNLTALQECIARESCVGFIGAGLSAEECLNWWELVKLILERLPTDCPPLELEYESDYLLRAVDAVIGKHGWQAVYRVVYETMGNKMIGGHYGVLQHIKFKHFVTTNYDHALERALRHRGLSQFAHPLKKLQLPKESSCIYLHGKLSNSADDATPLVLARQHYKDAYGEFKPNSVFLANLMSTHSVCFVGAGMKDPPLVSCLSALRSLREEANIAVPGGLEVYLILPCPHSTADEYSRERARVTAEWNEKGVRAVCYQVSEDSRHHQLAQLLEQLTSLKPLPVGDSFVDLRRPTGGTNAF